MYISICRCPPPPTCCIPYDKIWQGIPGEHTKSSWHLVSGEIVGFKGFPETLPFFAWVTSFFLARKRQTSSFDAHLGPWTHFLVLERFACSFLLLWIIKSQKMMRSVKGTKHGWEWRAWLETKYFSFSSSSACDKERLLDVTRLLCCGSLLYLFCTQNYIGTAGVSGVTACYTLTHHIFVGLAKTTHI
jgi:hypothetical protein